VAYQDPNVRVFIATRLFRNDGSMNDQQDPIFHWLFPGETRVATWAIGRVQKVQGNSKELVAGAYIVLAAMWGSLGGVVCLIGIVIDITSKDGSPGTTYLLVGLVGVIIGILRQLQSRRARQRNRP
jgi:hypothetical protein